MAPGFFQTCVPFPGKRLRENILVKDFFSVSETFSVLQFKIKHHSYTGFKDTKTKKKLIVSNITSVISKQKSRDRHDTIMYIGFTLA